MWEDKRNILIIDDDKAILRIFTRILQGAGYLTDTAETGGEAIEKVRTKSYDLALIDIKLPDTNGTDLLSVMKTTRPKMVKIMITGYPSLENCVKSKQEGAEGYLVKPVEPRELLKIIDEKLNRG